MTIPSPPVRFFWLMLVLAFIAGLFVAEMFLAAWFGLTGLAD